MILFAVVQGKLDLTMCRDYEMYSIYHAITGKVIIQDLTPLFSSVHSFRHAPCDCAETLVMRKCPGEKIVYLLHLTGGRMSVGTGKK